MSIFTFVYKNNHRNKYFLLQVKQLNNIRLKAKTGKHK